MDILESVRAVLGNSGVVEGAELQSRAGDWMGQTACGARAIIRPRSTLEVAEVMRLCHAARQPVVAAGGLTGLVHGADASAEELQISFERMRAVTAIDTIGRTMTVEAGLPLQAAQEAAEAEGMIYPVDLGARGSATIGGTISTNAGGNQVIRYGMTRDNVLGLEAVLADGTLVSSMNRLLKNNAAYDLKQMFIGTEGTLGLVTHAVLKLRPRPLTCATAILAIDGFDNVLRLFDRVSSKLGGMLSSFEVMWQSHYHAIAIDSGRHQAPLPAGHDYYIIIEANGMDPDRDEEYFTATMVSALEDEVAADAVIAGSHAQRDAIWAVREDIEGLMHALAPCAVFDVSLPISAMESYVAELGQAIEQEWGADARHVVFGHLGDGNLHIGIAPRPWSEATRHKAEELVYRPLAGIDGSISAEHGIGLEKRGWLHLCRSAEEIATMRLLKRSLDPHNLLNPGKVFAPGETA